MDTDLPHRRCASALEKKPPRPPSIEPREVQGLTSRDLFLDEASDQEATDHEEDVDSNEAALGSRKVNVEEYYGENREASQAVDVGTVLQGSLHRKAIAVESWRLAEHRRRGPPTGSQGVAFRWLRRADRTTAFAFRGIRQIPRATGSVQSWSGCLPSDLSARSESQVAGSRSCASTSRPGPTTTSRVASTRGRSM